MNLVIANSLMASKGGSTGVNRDTTLVAGPLGGGNDGIGRRTEDDPNLVVGTFQNTGHGWWNQTPVAQSIRTPEGSGSMEANLVTHALTADGRDASEDGTGRGTPLYYSHDYNQARIYGVNGPAPAHTAQDSNRARNISTGSSIRRLTPLECERLQGFPDGATCLCTPLEVYAADPDGAALACRCPDSPRYRALGNAVTVPVITWFARRIAALLTPPAGPGG